jgi:hypothetical protein
VNAISASRFTEFMLSENGLDRQGFLAWAFLPGMLFKAADKWWGDRGKRTHPHEGLDFCLFNDRWGRLFRLGEGARIPAMYGGTVVAIIDDLLGTSIVLEHRLPERGGLLLTIYGHTVVGEVLRLKSAVRAGEIIGTLADSRKSKVHIHPHLHVSLARPSEGATCDGLTWRDLSDPGLFTMIDPLDVIDGPYLVLDGIEQSPELIDTAYFIESNSTS